MQSPLHTNSLRQLHVAIIMDGSGRWATNRGLSRQLGHRAGVEAVRRVVAAADRNGIGTLTLFAFSGDNWHRPSPEVASLMHIFEDYFRSDLSYWLTSGTRLSVVGRRDRLGIQLLGAIEEAETETAHGKGLHLRIALDYSGRDSILQAARGLQRRYIVPTRESFAELLGELANAKGPSPNIDLLVRTGGEQRLSDFMLWESAYAELIFTDRLWPDFGAADLDAVIAEYLRRDRRFGRIGQLVAS